MKTFPCIQILLILQLFILNSGTVLNNNNNNHAKQNATELIKLDDWKLNSLGSPSLSNISSSKNTNLSFVNLFEITPNGFNIFIEFLSEAQKKEIIEQIQNKYGIDVRNTEKIKPKFSQLTCFIDIICDFDQKPLKLNGSTNFKSWFPLKVEFNDSTKCFEQYLAEYQHVNINCSAFRNSKTNTKKPFMSFQVEYKDGKNPQIRNRFSII